MPDNTPLPFLRVVVPTASAVYGKPAPAHRKLAFQFAPPATSREVGDACACAMQFSELVLETPARVVAIAALMLLASVGEEAGLSDLLPDVVAALWGQTNV